MKLARRAFLSMTALGTAAGSLCPRLTLAALAPAQRIRVYPFPLHAVRLGPGPALEALAVNRRFLMDLDPDRLLHMFRVTAGLPSSAQPLGGWEAPDNELRGHFTGHYLSACAQLAAHTDDAAVRARGVQVCAELAKCQAALGGGYLSAFPEELFTRLRAGQPAWAPFYTLHKIMAGLFDTHTLSGDRGALGTLLGMARWTERWTQPLDAQQMARVIEREYGGMNELLYNLAAATGEPRWRSLAHRFDRERVFAPLAAGRDELQGLHANTTIPQIIGAARGYELTGDPHLHDAATHFWHTVAERRTYCTGGTSNGESWNTPPGASWLASYPATPKNRALRTTCASSRVTCTAGPRTHDSPTTSSARYYNGILGVQHPDDGDKLYYLPLQSGYWKLFGTPLHDFWCCTGSMAESFASLGDSIYFHDADGVYVNLFTPSTLDWQERGIRLTQETRFPEDETVRLRVHSSRPARFALRLRMPSWSRAVAGAPQRQSARLRHAARQLPQPGA